jgi:hypothetical protein
VQTVTVRPTYAGLLSAGITGVLMLVLGATGGPFGFSIMLLAAAYLVIPAFLLCAGLALSRPERWAGFGLAILLVLGVWALALAVGAGVANAVGRLPGTATSDFSIGITWLILMSPFAVVGAAIGTIALIIQRRHGSREEQSR